MLHAGRPASVMVARVPAEGRFSWRLMRRRSERPPNITVSRAIQEATIHIRKLVTFDSRAQRNLPAAGGNLKLHTVAQYIEVVRLCHAFHCTTHSQRPVRTFWLPVDRDKQTKCPSQLRVCCAVLTAPTPRMRWTVPCPPSHRDVSRNAVTIPSTQSGRSTTPK